MYHLFEFTISNVASHSRYDHMSFDLLSLSLDIYICANCVVTIFYHCQDAKGNRFSSWRAVFSWFS